MKTILTYAALTLATLALAGSAQGVTTQHHSHYRPSNCSVHQAPRTELACGKRALHRDSCARRWTRNHPDSPVGGHSVAYFNWRVRVAHRRIGQARFRIAVSTPRGLARMLVLRNWHSEAQWQDLNGIIVPESNWDPCAHFPSTHDCGYQGINACGIPQADPCPTAWLGHLDNWRRQVFWLINYVKRRYGTPAVAYQHHQAGMY